MWDSELHEELGTNADAVTELESSEAKDVRSLAEGEVAGVGQVAEDAPFNMGGVGQGDQGLGVSVGPRPAGAVSPLGRSPRRTSAAKACRASWPHRPWAWNRR